MSRAERRAAGDREDEPAAQALADLAEDQPVGERQLDAEQPGGVCSRSRFGSASLADAERPVEDPLLEAAGPGSPFSSTRAWTFS